MCESKLEELKVQYSQDLRVKNAMLDDQNDTIRTLKGTLESKIRSFGKLQDELQQVHERAHLESNEQHITALRVEVVDIKLD